MVCTVMECFRALDVVVLLTVLLVHSRWCTRDRYFRAARGPSVSQQARFRVSFNSNFIAAGRF